MCFLLRGETWQLQDLLILDFMVTRGLYIRCIIIIRAKNNDIQKITNNKFYCIIKQELLRMCCFYIMETNALLAFRV